MSEGKYKKSLLIILIVAIALNLFFAWQDNSKPNLIVGVSCLILLAITIIRNKNAKKE